MKYRYKKYNVIYYMKTGNNKIKKFTLEEIIKYLGDSRSLDTPIHSQTWRSDWVKKPTQDP